MLYGFPCLHFEQKHTNLILIPFIRVICVIRVLFFYLLVFVFALRGSLFLWMST